MKKEEKATAIAELTEKFGRARFPCAVGGRVEETAAKAEITRGAEHVDAGEPGTPVGELRVDIVSANADRADRFVTPAG